MGRRPSTGARLMAALPGDDVDPDDWDDEWNRDDWSRLDELDRGRQNQDSWGRWAVHLLGIALVLPLVLGILVLLLILAF